MKKMRLSVWSLVLFVVSVPMILLFMWIIDSLFGNAENDSVIVQIAAVISVVISCIGTSVGFLLAIIGGSKERKPSTILVPPIPLLGIVLNGLSSLLWLLLIIIMIVAELG